MAFYPKMPKTTAQPTTTSCNKQAWSFGSDPWTVPPTLPSSGAVVLGITMSRSHGISNNDLEGMRLKEKSILGQPKKCLGAPKMATSITNDCEADSSVSSATCKPQRSAVTSSSCSLVCVSFWEECLLKMSGNRQRTYSG